MPDDVPPGQPTLLEPPPRRVAGRPAGPLGRAFVAVYWLLQWPARLMLAMVRPFGGVYRTFFGSDIYNRYTAVYSWCADQAGHVAIGTAFGAFAWFLARDTVVVAGWPDAAEWFAIGAACLFLYVVKEVADAIVALEPDRDDPAHRQPPFFEVDAVELGLDGSDDSLFVAFGLGIAHAPFAPAAWSLALLALGLWLAWRTSRALRVFARFDESGVPDYMRLRKYARLVARLPDSAGLPDGEPVPATVAQFLAAVAEAPRTVVIAGARGATGRTALASGIACEMMVAGHRVRHTTARLLREGRWQEDDRRLIGPAEAQVLVVDDIPLDSSARLHEVAGLVAASRGGVPPRLLVMVAVGPGAEDPVALSAAARAVPGPALLLQVQPK